MTAYLPDWMDPGEDLFVDGSSWRLLYGLGVDPGWPETWQRGLWCVLVGSVQTRQRKTWGTPEADVAVLCKLLRYEGRTPTGRPATGKAHEIRSDCRTSLIEWLETPVAEQTWDSPFSARAWDRLSVLRGPWSGYGPIAQLAERRTRAVRAELEAGEDWPEACRDLVPFVAGDVARARPKPIFAELLASASA